MFRNFLMLVLLCLPLLAPAYPGKIDSLSAALKKTNSDTAKAIILRRLSAEFRPFKPDTALELALRSHLLAERANFLTGQSDALNEMASSYRLMGNYPQALENYLKQLKIIEVKNDTTELARINMSISNVYQEQGDQVKALTYALLSNKIIEEANIQRLRFYSYYNLGDIYEKLKNADSAIHYTQKAYQIAVQQKKPQWIGSCLNNFGNDYMLTRHYGIALANYRRAVPLLEDESFDDILCESLMGISEIMFLQGRNDSAIHYAGKSLQLAQQARFAKRVLNASTALNKYYRQSGDLANAYLYQSNVLAMKDSLYSLENIKHLQNLTIVENIRQKELAEMKRLDKEEREKRLQLLIVGLLIPLSFLVSIMLAKKKIKPRVVEFSGIISLLLFFEYITMLIHPWVMEVTHHTPAYEIVIFVLIAAVITPSHHRFEHWLITKLTHHRGRKYQAKEEHKEQAGHT